jgi:hypothetical protein
MRSGNLGMTDFSYAHPGNVHKVGCGQCERAQNLKTTDFCYTNPRKCTQNVGCGLCARCTSLDCDHAVAKCYSTGRYIQISRKLDFSLKETYKSKTRYNYSSSSFIPANAHWYTIKSVLTDVTNSKWKIVLLNSLQFVLTHVTNSKCL